MSPASYQTAPPRVAVSSSHGPGVRPSERGKRDSNPRPQPWQGCALPTELYPRAAAKSNRSVGRVSTAPTSPTSPTSPTLLVSGGEGDRTPDLVNAIHALSQLSYAPRILGPAKRVPAGTRHLTGTVRWCQAMLCPGMNFSSCSRYYRGIRGL